MERSDLRTNAGDEVEVLHRVKHWRLKVSARSDFHVIFEGVTTTMFLRQLSGLSAAS